jgi:hypothetical protein
MKRAGWFLGSIISCFREISHNWVCGSASWRSLPQLEGIYAPIHGI